eukprot:TRINITY_DN458_c1_g2_i3.p1 TRINITY_DN458_c1_g2~~TRINITY_DN458_c1_g2_i3.p1  ORF type:complete len:1473 (+),score=559.25 TRINITY_DN458_c1_g2_i3:217-4419(+)
MPGDDANGAHEDLVERVAQLRNQILLKDEIIETTSQRVEMERERRVEVERRYEAKIERMQHDRGDSETVASLEAQIELKNEIITGLNQRLVAAEALDVPGGRQSTQPASRRSSSHSSSSPLREELLTERIRQLEDQLAFKDDIVENANQRAAEAEALLAEVQGKSTSEIAELRRQLIQSDPPQPRRSQAPAALVTELEAEVRRLTALNNDLLGDENDTISELRARLDEVLTKKTEAEKAKALLELEIRQKNIKIETLSSRVESQSHRIDELILRQAEDHTHSLELSNTQGAELQGKIAGVKEELAAEQERHRVTLKKLHSVEMELDEARGEVSQHGAVVKGLKEEIVILQDNNAVLRKQLNNFRVNVSTSRASDDEAQGLLDRLRESEQREAETLQKLEKLQKEYKKLAATGSQLIPAPRALSHPHDSPTSPRTVYAELDAAQSRGKLDETAAMLASTNAQNKQMKDVLARAAASELEMARLNDLVASLEIEKASLQGELQHHKSQGAKAAGLATENSKLKSELAQAQSDKAALDATYGKVARELVGVKGALKSMEKEAEEARKGKGDLEDEVQRLRGEVAFMEANLDRAVGNDEGMQNEIRQLTLEKIDLESEVGVLKRRAAMVEAELTSLRAKYEADQSTIDSLHSAAIDDSKTAANMIRELERERAALRHKVHSLEQQIRDAESEGAEMSKSLKAAKESLKAAAKRHETELMLEKDSYRKSASTVERKLAAAEGEVAKLRSNLKNVKEGHAVVVAELQDGHAALERQLSTAKAENARLKTALQDQTDVAEAENATKILEVEKEKTALKHRVAAAEAEVAQLTRSLESVRESFKEADREHASVDDTHHKAIKKLEHEKTELRYKNMSLEEELAVLKASPLPADTKSSDDTWVRDLEKEKASLRHKNVCLEQQLAAAESEISLLKTNQRRSTTPVGSESSVERENANLRRKNTLLEQQQSALEAEVQVLRRLVEKCEAEHVGDTKTEAGKFSEEWIRDLEKEKANLRHKNTSLEQQLASIEAEVQVLRRLVEKCEVEHSGDFNTELLLNETEKEKAGLRKKLAAAEAELSLLRSRDTGYNEGWVRDLEKEKANLRHKNSSLEQQLATVESELRAMSGRKCGNCEAMTRRLEAAERDLVDIERLKQQVANLLAANRACEAESSARIRELEHEAASVRSQTPPDELLRQIERGNLLQARLEGAEKRIESLQAELITKKIEYEYSTRRVGNTTMLGEKAADIDRKLQDIQATAREVRTRSLTPDRIHSYIGDSMCGHKSRGVSPVRASVPAPYVGSPLGEYPRLFNVNHGDDLDLTALQNRPHPMDLVRPRPVPAASRSLSYTRVTPTPVQRPPRLQSTVSATPSKADSSDTVTVPRRYLESVYHNTNLSRRYWQHKIKDKK